jgi:tetratricopeptide (TPR) repeat protein/tRNA A-37 threonylcarbamoyl transferase component Bud32
MRTGTKIGHYRLGDLLGQGGMGDVYRAVDTRLDRPVAIKFLARRLVSDPDAKARFIREAKAASALDHPNICTIHDVGETEEGDLYLVMALYDGDTLQRRLTREAFSVERTMHIVRQVAQALKRAHAAGIVHRDIKPANTMVGDDDAVRLLDFGLAKLQTGESLTATGTTIGTAAYMSPEQASGEEVTPASDVWSLAVMAYEMLAGERPFQASHPLALLNRILTAEPPLLSDLGKGVPPALGAVIQRALEKEPARRYADASEFLDALDAATAGPAHAAQVTAAAPGSRPLKRWALPGAAAVVVSVLGISYAIRHAASRAGASAENAQDVIAVLPFTVNGAPDLAYLSEGLMDLVAGRLDGAGPLRTVDTRAVVGRTGQESDQAMDAARGAELAASLGAGRFVTGQVVGLSGRLSISARMRGVGPSAAEQPLVTVEGGVDSLFTLVDRLAAGLLETSISGANARIQRSAAQSSRSIQATKEFLRGEQFHRHGQFDSASAAYNRALTYDSTFALAHLMKSMNNSYTYDTDDYMAAVNAMRYSDGLPDRDRSLIAAFLDQQSGRETAAAQGYIAHLKRYPDEVKALLQLAVVYTRANPRWGRPMDQASPFFERVLALEPDNVPALHNLGRLDAAARRYDSLLVRSRALDRVAPNSEWAVDVGTMAAFALKDSVALARYTADFAHQSLLVRLYSEYNALRFSDDPRDVERLLARERGGAVNTATGLPAGVAVDSDLSLVIEALYWIATGRYDRVRAFLADSTRSRTATWNVWDAELVASDVVPVDSALLAQVLGRVEADDPHERLRTLFEPLHDIFTPAVMTLERDVSVARLLARQGRFDEAWEIQRRISQMPKFTAFESLREDAAGGLAADIYYHQGDHQKALEVLRTVAYQVPPTATALSITQGSHARFLRAELELERGDPEVARAFYEGLVNDFAPPDKLFLTASYERLGRIHEAAGRTGEAIYYYDRFVKEWVDADSALVPGREAVQRRLEALRAKADQ